MHHPGCLFSPAFPTLRLAHTPRRYRSTALVMHRSRAGMLVSSSENLISDPAAFSAGLCPSAVRTSSSSSSSSPPPLVPGMLSLAVLRPKNNRGEFCITRTWCCARSNVHSFRPHNSHGLHSLHCSTSLVSRLGGRRRPTELQLDQDRQAGVQLSAFLRFPMTVHAAAPIQPCQRLHGEPVSSVEDIHL